MRNRPIAHLGARVLLALLLVAPHLPASPAPAQAQPATIVVSTSADSGPGSLRQAILDANATAGLDTITFSIGSGTQVITPTTALPSITDPVIVDGTTQPGYAGTPLIALDGGAIAGDADGLHITAGGSSVRGLAVYRFSDAIELEGNGGNLVERNELGRLEGWGNGTGLRIASSNNTVGGTASGAGNAIYDNDAGILLTSGTGNALLGNSIFDSSSDGAAICMRALATCQQERQALDDPLDVDAGPNNLQNAPRLFSVVTSTGVLSITGWFNGTPNTALRLEFFASPENTYRNPMRDYLGASQITTDASGNARFTAVVPGSYPIRTQINATATDPHNNTSEPSAPAYVGSIYTVTTTADSGPGSLRQALLEVSGRGSSLIRFAIGAGGPQTIRPLSVLPPLVGGLIDGTTQPGYAGTPLIELDGTYSNAGPGIILAGDHSAVRGLAINRFWSAGVRLVPGASDSLIEGCYIGLDLSGSIAYGNGTEGVVTEYGGFAGGTMVGGTWPGARNVIAGHSSQEVLLDGASNIVQNNYIGTDASGTQDLSNAFVGVNITTGALVGGADPAARNIISGGRTSSHAPGSGVYVSGSYNTVRGNYIGTDAHGTGDLGNDGYGIRLVGATGTNTIGGSAPGEGNLIAYNGSSGIVLDAINQGQMWMHSNRLLGNRIFANGALGIDLGDDGVTPNDVGDTDGSYNNLQNFPVVEAITRDELQISITGTLSSKPSTAYWLEFFESAEADPSGYGEGQWYLGGRFVTTDAAGAATFTVTLDSKGLLHKSWLSATATDPSGNTSELGPVAAVPAHVSYMVTTSADSGPGSLRQAILEANAEPGLDLIGFAIGSGAQVITPTTALPSITDPVIVDGTTQPGYAGTPLVQLDGGAIDALEVDGLQITSGGSTVRGLALINFNRSGIVLSAQGGNVIERNVIGPIGPSGYGAGVRIASSNNTIGGTAEGAGNSLRKLWVGILVLSGTGNALLGNEMSPSSAGSGAVLCFGPSSDLFACDGYAERHNDPLDGDSGPNDLINTPRIVSAVTSTQALSITGWYNGSANMSLRIELFASPDDPGSTEGMGQYLGFTTIRTDASGNARFLAVLPGSFSFPPQTRISATATDEDNNTSGMSRASTLGATYTVTTTADSGPGSLRDALASGAKLIRFNIGGGAYQTIQPLSPLPPLRGGLIDGTTQPGAFGSPVIQLDGSLAGSTAHGLTIEGTGEASGVRGLTINRFGYIGILIGEDSPDTLIEGNHIGTDPSGAVARGNGFSAIVVEQQSDDGGAMIGGTLPGSRNTIAQDNPESQTYGLWIEGPYNIVQGNNFGVNRGSSRFIGAAHTWINLWDGNTHHNLIGGPSPAAANIIAAGTHYAEGGGSPVAISVEGDENTIRGNAIGTSRNGFEIFGGTGDGIRLGQSASGNTMGGSMPGEGNVIGHLAGRGIVIESTAMPSVRNRIQGNEIFDNGGLDIDLGGDGVTPNDAGDLDTGPNELQNFPVIAAVQLHGSPAVSVTITGTLSSKPNATYWLEFFEDTHQTSSQWPNRQFYLGGHAVITNAGGIATFVVTFAADGAEPQSSIRATATDPAGNTSELSPAPTTPQPPTYPTLLPLVRLDL